MRPATRNITLTQAETRTSRRSATPDRNRCRTRPAGSGARWTRRATKASPPATRRRHTDFLKRAVKNRQTGRPKVRERESTAGVIQGVAEAVKKKVINN